MAHEPLVSTGGARATLPEAALPEAASPEAASPVRHLLKGGGSGGVGRGGGYSGSGGRWSSTGKGRWGVTADGKSRTSIARTSYLGSRYQPAGSTRYYGGSRY